MKKTIKERQVKEALAANPTITSIEELCAFRGIKLTPDTPQKDIDIAKDILERNRLKICLKIKKTLLKQGDLKSMMLIYKMICDEGDLKRFGIATKETQIPQVNVSPEIVIKAADPDIVKKLGNL